MSKNYQLTLALKALREVQTELGREQAAGQALFPSLTDVLETLEAPHPDTLLFGVASDGLPLLLNLRDPRTGPLLILGDRGSGKTAFLQFLAHATNRLLPSEKVRYAVLTNFPDEWRDFESAGHCIDILPGYGDSTTQLLYELACQVEAAETGPANPAVLLFFDGLDSVLQLDQAGQENLLYLLHYGPKAAVWPIVSVNAAQATKLQQWLTFFHTRIYGRIDQAHVAAELTPLPGAGLNTLFPGAQFCLRQKSHWLRFWMPSL
jgi:hypothetical protein